MDEDCLNSNQSGPGDYGNEGDPYNPGNYETIGGNGGNGGNSPTGGYTPQETNPNEQNPNEGNQTDPSHDIGDDSVITTPFIPDKTTKRPCGHLKRFGDPNTVNLKPGIDWLKARVNSANNNIEYAVEVSKRINQDEETYRYEKEQVTSNAETSVELTTSIFHIGAAHSHPKSGDAMFSFGDVKCLIDFYDRVNESRKEEVFLTLVCKNNAGEVNVYTLKIDDIELLRAKVDEEWNSPKHYGKNDEDKLKKIHRNQSIKYANSGNQLEKSFLQQFSGFGISLYKATDDSMTNWNKLELSSTALSTVNSIPCN